MKKISNYLNEHLENILIYFIIIFLVSIFTVCEMTTSIGLSMYPGGRTGDLDIFLRGNVLVSRGDIVSVDSSKTDIKGVKKELNKRVVAEPGDWFVIYDDDSYLNGSWIEEEFAVKSENTIEKMAFHAGFNEFVVLGDNRMNSLDSRKFNKIKREAITSRYLYKIDNIDRRPKAEKDAELRKYNLLEGEDNNE